MVRRIIRIDGEKCDGCGLCVSACHEGAIGMADGKASLLRDDYCDGLGDCLPACPTGAITFEEREAAAYDGEAVKAGGGCREPETLACGCPGTQSKALGGGRHNGPELGEGPSRPRTDPEPGADHFARTDAGHGVGRAETHLSQWPIQIRLVPVEAPYLDGSHLLIAADCAAYAFGDFHAAYMRRRITLIGCPKLDPGDYSEKLTAILSGNEIKSVTVVRMEVPCCGGIENAVKKALKDCGKMIPWQVAVISTDGRVLDE
ncbi:MAG: 4Fe-4S binding protein [Oscillospiraceae bacterium]|nr:4Fe-4S binding protein [Oscillospiraceae bacterium]